MERTRPNLLECSFENASNREQNIINGAQNNCNGNGPHFPGCSFYFQGSSLPGGGPTERDNPVEECLKSLSFGDMEKRYASLTDALEGTCDWLLKHNVWKDWCSRGRGLLHIEGKPGSGKSTLLKYALAHVTTTSHREEGAVVLSFFFHDRGSELQRTPLGLFRALLHQLLVCDQEATAGLVAFFQKRCNDYGKYSEKWQWQLSDLRAKFQTSLANVMNRHSVWLFVDALDECGQYETTEDLVNVLESLGQSTCADPRLHICFTSRHIANPGRQNWAKIKLDDNNQQDISAYVRYKLADQEELENGQIADLILNKAGGVFLWVHLAIQEARKLNRKGSPLKEIEKAIQQNPSELDELYNVILEKNLEQKDMGHARNLIAWICFAAQPLRLVELKWAMSIDVNHPHKSFQEYAASNYFIPDNEIARLGRRVHALSGGLAEVANPESTVQFIHQSAKEFFVNKGLRALEGAEMSRAFVSASAAGSPAENESMIGNTHHRLSLACIRYLEMREVQESLSDMTISTDLETKFPFLRYASASWVAHMKQSDAMGIDQHDILERFAEPSNNLMKQWVLACSIFNELPFVSPSKGATIAHILSQHAISGALRSILDKPDRFGLQIDDPTDDDQSTPLMWAVERGHESIVRLLVRGGADLKKRNQYGETTLHQAARAGQGAVIQLLLKEYREHVDIEARDDLGRTPLITASNAASEDILGSLLDQGADIEAADKNGYTPLWEAYIGKNWTIADWLLSKSANIEARNKRGRTPLMEVAFQGRSDIIEILLTKGAKIEATDKHGYTPLWIACRAKQWGPALKLLDKGASIEAADRNGRTLLHVAVKARKKSIIRALLKKGADIKAKDRSGETPLSVAKKAGDKYIVELLTDA